MTSRANHIVRLATVLFSAGFGLFWCPNSAQAAGETPRAEVEGVFPIASDVRIAGDEKQTRFILDLDRKIPLRAFTLADPYRVVIDLPQVNFHLDPGAGTVSRGLIKAFRYGLVMPGGSRMVFDLTGPAKIKNSYALDPANGQPARMVIELELVDRTTFVQALAVENRPDLRPAVGTTAAASPVATKVVASAVPDAAPDARPVIVIDPGHGGIDNGTQAGGESEKGIVLGFGLALRDRLEKLGKYRIVMTRADDTFIPLDERVKVARNQSAALFVSIHADALPRGEGDAQGATVYTLSDKASDAEAERLADSGKQGRRHRRRQSDGRANRRCRHSDRLGAARNPDLLKPLCPACGGRDEDHGADAQASPEIGRFPRAQGPGRPLGADRTGLRV